MSTRHSAPHEVGMSSEVDCSWAGDTPHNPEIVRLVTRDRRRAGRANLPWQESFLSQVVSFVRSSLGGGELPVIVTPAGTLTATLHEEVERDHQGYETALVDLHRQIAPCLPHGNTRATLLIGVDGRKSGETLVQTALWWEHRLGIIDDAVSLKVHPAPGERLLGDALARRDDQKDPLIGRRRCIRNKTMPLVCHELAIFSGRSEAAVSDADVLNRRELLRDLAGRRSVRYVAALAHSLGMHEAGAFLNAMRKLAEDEGVTVVVAGAVSSDDDLKSVADRFAPVGPDCARVATLLVENQ